MIRLHWCDVSCICQVPILQVVCDIFFFLCNFVVPQKGYRYRTDVSSKGQKKNPLRNKILKTEFFIICFGLFIKASHSVTGLYEHTKCQIHCTGNVFLFSLIHMHFFLNCFYFPGISLILVNCCCVDVFYLAFDLLLPVIFMTFFLSTSENYLLLNTVSFTYFLDLWLSINFSEGQTFLSLFV